MTPPSSSSHFPSPSSANNDFHSLSLEAHGSLSDKFISQFRLNYTIIPIAQKSNISLPFLTLSPCSFTICSLRARLHSLHGPSTVFLKRETSQISARVNDENGFTASPSFFSVDCFDELFPTLSTTDEQPKEPSIISISSSSSDPSSSPPPSSSLLKTPDNDFCARPETFVKSDTADIKLQIHQNNLVLTFLDTTTVSKVNIVLEIHIPVLRDFVTFEQYIPLMFLPSPFETILSFDNLKSDSPSSDLHLGWDHTVSKESMSQSIAEVLNPYNKGVSRSLNDATNMETYHWSPFPPQFSTFNDNALRLRIYYKPKSWLPKNSSCSLSVDVKATLLETTPPSCEVSYNLLLTCRSSNRFRLFPASTPNSNGLCRNDSKCRFLMILPETIIKSPSSFIGDSYNIANIDPPSSMNVQSSEFRVGEVQSFTTNTSSFAFTFKEIVQLGSKASVPMILFPAPSNYKLTIEKPPFPCDLTIPHTAINDSWLPMKLKETNAISYYRKTCSSCKYPFQFFINKLPFYQSPSLPLSATYVWIASALLSVQPGNGSFNIMLSLKFVSSMKPGTELLTIKQPKSSLLNWGLVNGYPKTEGRIVLLPRNDIVLIQADQPTSVFDLCWTIKPTYEKSSNFSCLQLPIPVLNTPILTPVTINIQSTTYYLIGYANQNSKKTLDQPTSLLVLGCKAKNVSELILSYLPEKPIPDGAPIVTNVVETNKTNEAPSSFRKCLQQFLVFLTFTGMTLFILYQLTFPYGVAKDNSSFIDTPLPHSCEMEKSLNVLQHKVLQLQAVNMKLHDYYEKEPTEIYKTVSVTSTQIMPAVTKMSSFELEREQFHKAFGFLRLNRKKDDNAN
ncbi:Schizosaccharomyces specific protein, DNAJ domain [Schizosaccharomyces pombe]|uniref:Meiotically up-regulated gene 4 protein n=1 Tax=Schizosaccharomyces pombe (strain 972 / ATCC 24843) TaxID=284812 RepID=MUG4_SCHPO|nr:protein mug4 [Schizosaccharomyces pombe]O94719.1 RecName: Full=Meiotically up-regulated gene 4 protein [Schizosaccharomyces pombe 972h-]CAB38163.1 sequence orphan [Schizosaccharomyces pombe]|eukprot:NP_587965.1 protein mug4 [Schizosaccharomyces pombe]